MRNTMFPTSSYEGIMLSSENDHRNQPASERFLWCAVIKVAVDDLDEVTSDKNCSFRWFLSDNIQPGSFLWICFHLDIEPDYIIKKIAPILLKHIRNAKGAKL